MLAALPPPILKAKQRVAELWPRLCFAIRLGPRRRNSEEQRTTDWPEVGNLLGLWIGAVRACEPKRRWHKRRGPTATIQRTQ